MRKMEKIVCVRLDVWTGRFASVVVGTSSKIANAVVGSSSGEDLAGEDLVEEAPEARDML
jgi:hypothetical protein